MKLISVKLMSATLIGIAILLLVFNVSITSRLMEMNDQACASSCGPDLAFCPYNHEVPIETFLISFVALILGAAGVYTYFSFSPNGGIEIRQRSPSDYEAVKKGLKDDESLVLDMLIHEGGMYQSDIVERTGFSKVKISRILDRLETRDLIERRRRGMTNFIILK